MVLAGTLNAIWGSNEIPGERRNRSISGKERG